MHPSAPQTDPKRSNDDDFGPRGSPTRRAMEFVLGIMNFTFSLLPISSYDRSVHYVDPGMFSVYTYQ